MKAIKVMASIDEHGQLRLDSPIITDKNSRVEVIVLIPEEVEASEDDTPDEVILEDFRTAWHEARTGQAIPINQVWEGLEDV
ncbi:hypothetical protein DSM106972_047260 [Dulcicalothrix desertica PCC 7102]|uniref:Uncharacterized protein n=1 Tax=Dulcicalothrix desertica PCC 7102 TaxID=232991 RepID=A0A3S1ALD8_9CYAN|nr:hypothetical protein [Dulcicalothrix desertica]RUT03812.1 hypothetical protein DSM106972_047260 [Dulcicalothrix desertica PCC 7102]TWH43779.1 hypothetical protein CAL7102_07523 [Dulcicalothrix desertica PCC 7102]